MTGGCEVKGFAADTAAATTPIRADSCRFVVKGSRRASNEGTLRSDFWLHSQALSAIYRMSEEQKRQKRLDPKANWERLSFRNCLQGAYNFGTLVNSTKERRLSTHYGEEETHKEANHKEEQE